MASRFCATVFERFGLKPAGDGGTYFQNFDIIRREVDAEASGLEVKDASGAERFPVEGNMAMAVTDDIEWTGRWAFVGNGEEPARRGARSSSAGIAVEPTGWCWSSLRRGRRPSGARGTFNNGATRIVVISEDRVKSGIGIEPRERAADLQGAPYPRERPPPRAAGRLHHPSPRRPPPQVPRPHRGVPPTSGRSRPPARAGGAGGPDHHQAPGGQAPGAERGGDPRGVRPRAAEGGGGHRRAPRPRGHARRRRCSTGPMTTAPARGDARPGPGDRLEPPAPARQRPIHALRRRGEGAVGIALVRGPPAGPAREAASPRSRWT